MKPFFSVIIPTLNEEKYLPKILQSLVKQTFRDFELIVVDGDSKDKTLKVFNGFKHLLPCATSILSDKKNVGLQRNIGAGRARGNYLIFFDADVDIAPTFLEEIHVRAIKQPFLLATTWMIADSSKPIDQLMVTLANFGWELANSINKPMIGGYNVIVKQEIFKKLKGFREDLTINEDGDFASRAVKKHITLAFLPEPKIVISLRRFRAEGMLQLLRKYTKVQIYSLLKGPITTKLIDYPMGGHVHIRKKKGNNSLVDTQTYIRSMKKIIRKFNQLIS